jgi:hypothetical protein
MSDLGYHEQIEGGIYGTPNPTTDSSPEDRAAFQEAAVQQQILLATVPGVVPQSYQGAVEAGPSNQQVGGPSNLPIIGWTAQANSNEPVFQPYSADHMGRIPDWTGDPNPIGAGAYDMNEVLTGLPVDPLNRAPLGDAVMQFDDTPNPNTVPQDDGGQIGRAEY